MRSEKRIKPFLRYIEKKWCEKPVLRFGQLLVNLGIITDSNFNWNAEIYHYPIPFEFLREIMGWGIFKGHRLEEASGSYVYMPYFEEKAISELSFNHILQILKNQTHISNYLKEILETELSLRLSNPDYFKGKILFKGAQNV